MAASSDSQQSHDSPREPETSCRGKTDIAWKYAREEKDPLTNKRSVTCLVCMKKIMGGGINRPKKHLAGQKGEIAPCKRVSPDVRYQMLESLKETSTKKRQREVEADDDRDNEIQEIEEVQMNMQTFVPITKNKNGGNKRVAGLSNQKSTGTCGYFAPRTALGSQPSIRSALVSKKVKKQTYLVVATWMFDACIPFNAIAAVGPGYKAPSYDDILTNAFSKVKKHSLS